MTRILIAASCMILVIGLATTLGAGLIAFSPSELEAPAAQTAPKPITVQLPDPPAKSEEPPPPEPQVQASLLSSLAPDSFQAAVDPGAGVGFGSGGGGPGIAGQGGFGENADRLVRDKTSVDRPPRAVNKTTPDYPAEARARGVSGYVVVKILVGADGQVNDLAVEESEPKGFFDQAALDSVRRWRFEPAILKGQMAAAWTRQKITFDLN